MTFTEKQIEAAAKALDASHRRNANMQLAKLWPVMAVDALSAAEHAREPVGDGPSARICALKDAEVAVRQRLIDLAHTYRGQEGKLSSAIFKAESIANMAICLLLSDARNGSPVPPAAPVLPMEPSEEAREKAKAVLFEKGIVDTFSVLAALRAAYAIDAKAPDAALHVAVDHGIPNGDRSVEILMSSEPRKFALEQRVRKVKGAKWQGRVVGFYSTALTPIGYAVESEREQGSVQIYPLEALEVAPPCADGDAK